MSNFESEARTFVMSEVEAPSPPKVLFRDVGDGLLSLATPDDIKSLTELHQREIRAAENRGWEDCKAALLKTKLVEELKSALFQDELNRNGMEVYLKNRIKELEAKK